MANPAWQPCEPRPGANGRGKPLIGPINPLASTFPFSLDRSFISWIVGGMESHLKGALIAFGVVASSLIAICTAAFISHKREEAARNEQRTEIPKDQESRKKSKPAAEVQQ